MRVVTRPTPAASMISSGWNTKRNCGTPKSNSAWKVESASRNPPVSATASSSRVSAGACSDRPAARFARMPSTDSTAIPTSVIAAPPISIRCVGPQSVTSCPNSRCQTSSSGKPVSENAPHAQISTPPSGACQSLVRRIADALGRSFGQHHRDEAGGEDAEQAGEDEVVGGVGERALVAADADVQRDVPVHPEHRGEQRRGGDRARQRDPAGQAGLARREARRACRGARPGRSGGPCRGRAGSA